VILRKEIILILHKKKVIAHEKKITCTCRGDVVKEQEADFFSFAIKLQ